KRVLLTGAVTRTNPIWLKAAHLAAQEEAVGHPRPGIAEIVDMARLENRANRDVFVPDLLLAHREKRGGQEFGIATEAADVLAKAEQQTTGRIEPGDTAVIFIGIADGRRGQRAAIDLAAEDGRFNCWRL